MALSPWDEMPFFQPVRESVVSIDATGPNVLVRPDPQRISLIISIAPGSAVTNCAISTRPLTALPAGINLLNTHGPHVYTQKEHGILCQSEWFGLTAAGTASVTVVEIFLSKWPEHPRGTSDGS
jgi:hypothetical protein